MKIIDNFEIGIEEKKIDYGLNKLERDFYGASRLRYNKKEKKR